MGIFRQLGSQLPLSATLVRGNRDPRESQASQSRASRGNKTSARTIVPIENYEGRRPLSVRERYARRIQEIEDELQRMEGEFHELNVQQIREELSGG